MHPVYGAFQPGSYPIPGFSRYEIDDHCVVRNRWSGRCLQPRNSQVSLLSDETQTFGNRRVYHLALRTFFPHVSPLATVDHIDENHHNHHLTNLQWASASDNAIKSNHLRPRKRLLHQILWEESEDLEGEQWGTSERLQQRLRSTRVGGQPRSEATIEHLRVSNRGRVQNRWGKRTWGARQHYTLYRRIMGLKIHTMVWDVWGHRAPSPGEYILHDDQQPLDAEGCVSNDIRHLRLGTQSENIKEWHAVKRNHVVTKE